MATATVPKRPAFVKRRRTAVGALVVLFGVELVVAWPSLTAALSRLESPHPGWVALALLAELAAMASYARMQRRLLRSAGVVAPLHRHVALAYAAHSLSVTLPGGPAFSTRLNYQQMRRFGATPAVASWCIALSGILSAGALASVTAVSVLAADRTPDWGTLAAFALAAALLTLGARRFARNPEKVAHLLAPINRLLRRPADRGLDRIAGFAAQLRAARLTPGHGVAAAAFAVLNWLLDAAALWLCFHAVSGGAPISVAHLLLTFCAGYAAATVTIVPGGLGVIDSALILGLVTAGVATSTAIAAVVLYRLISFGFIIGAGWIAWFLIRDR
ncbi:membrane protein [Actinoplanes capillaceus]|uniref:Membrane protein n=1 Tax=Actinoplanes campanulatus TaxID=113559 RepID=A0ABQ3WJQ7_9ACTN|nr:YbhN family protein [Actinoplanes capillaceus]GID46482.1 membrane protein [Actinoplanes capillaceus]